MVNNTDKSLLKLTTYPQRELRYGFPPLRSTNDEDGDISDDVAAPGLSSVKDLEDATKPEDLEEVGGLEGKGMWEIMVSHGGWTLLVGRHLILTGN